MDQTHKFYFQVNKNGKFKGKKTYLVGTGYSGNNLARISTTSPLWSTLSAQRYRPAAEGVSYTRIWARATSFTCTYAWTELAYVLADPVKYFSIWIMLALMVDCNNGPSTSTGFTTTKSTPFSFATSHAACSATAFP